VVPRGEMKQTVARIARILMKQPASVSSNALAPAE
jgi:hypothetical protein